MDLFCSDYASSMLGKKSGVSSRLLEKFPNIVVWHCWSHRLQLALDVAIKSVSQVNHFKIFLDKIYTYYHASTKNQSELSKIAEDLAVDINKTGRVFGPRWVACSLRTAKAVWKTYPVLYYHFLKNEETGMKTKLQNTNFLEDPALMIDILEELLTLLSLALQNQDTDLMKADRLIKRSIEALCLMKDSKGK